MAVTAPASPPDNAPPASPFAAVRHPVRAGLATVREGLDEAQSGSVWSLTGDEMLAEVELMERDAAREAALQLTMIAELDARGVAGRRGAPSTAALLRGRLRLTPAQAQAVLLDCAATLHAGDLHRAGVHLRHTVDPDGERDRLAAGERSAQARRRPGAGPARAVATRRR